MSKNKTMHALYFNGLTSGHIRKRERLAMRYLAKHGIEVVPAQVNWRHPEPFANLLSRMTNLAQSELNKHGSLLLTGTSAGGSLALNVFANLRHNQNVAVVTMCARLHDAKLPWWDRRTMKRMAYIGTPKESKTFMDSVEHCTNVAIPSLNKTDKQRITIIKQWMDDVVPRATMDIPGAQTITVPAIGHGWGMAMAVRLLPVVIEHTCTN